MLFKKSSKMSDEKICQYLNFEYLEELTANEILQVIEETCNLYYKEMDNVMNKFRDLYQYGSINDDNPRYFDVYKQLLYHLCERSLFNKGFYSYWKDNKWRILEGKKINVDKKFSDYWVMEQPKLLWTKELIHLDKKSLLQICKDYYDEIYNYCFYLYCEKVFYRGNSLRYTHPTTENVEKWIKQVRNMLNIDYNLKNTTLTINSVTPRIPIRTDDLFDNNSFLVHRNNMYKDPPPPYI